MITIEDLREAIDECETERNPTANTCIKLMAYYYLMEQYTGNGMEPLQYSTAPESATEVLIGDHGEGQFFDAIKGKPAKAVWPIMAELMSTLAVVKKPIHDSVMRQIAEI